MASRFASFFLFMLPQLTGAAFLNTTRSFSPSSRVSSGSVARPHPLSFRKDDTVSCSFSTTADDGDTCDSFSSEWGLTVEQFESLNPGVSCPDLVGGQLYCVVGTVSSSAPTPTSSSSSSGLTPPPTTTTSTTTTAKKTTSSSSAQHEPQQSGLAANCNDFYLVAAGDTCDAIESSHDITAAQFNKWNPSINADCTNLLSGYYVCVGVPGSKTTSPTKTTPKTTTTTGNGISTPTPTQSGMVNNCNKFDLVESGDSCSGIATKYNIPLSDFYKWNPAVGSSCGSLWAGYYVCVDIVGYTPTKTTSTGNGITTPTPYEPGMVGNCDKFYKVKSGDTCDKIASSQKVTTANIEKWNPEVKSDCSGLYLNYYICVGVK